MTIQTLVEYLIDAGVHPALMADVIRVYHSMVPMGPIACEVK